jgi:hypothetical protein
MPSPQHLLILWFAKGSLGSANFIKANTLNFQQPNSSEVTIRPTLRLRNPTFPESAMAAPGQVLQQNSACLVVGEALAICGSLSPGFTTLQPTVQAHCLCYSSTSWMPSIFDNAVESCADYASTAVPAAYQPLANLEGFCEGVGDIETPPTFFALTTMYQTAAPMISGFSGQPCNSVNSFLNGCWSLTPGFSSLQPTDQAKCLCYVSSRSWCPTAFDNAVATCAGFAQTAEPSVYAIISTLGGFCAGVGNILAITAASYSVAVATTLSAVPSPTLTPGPSSSRGAGSGIGGSTTETDLTITVGGVGATKTGTAKSGAQMLEPASEGEVIAISLVCALIVLFL